MNMKHWLEQLRNSPRKLPLPLLSFPSSSLLGISVRELIASSSLQAEGMARIAARHATAASVSMMDLSVEAEAFGSPIIVSDDEVPTVQKAIVTTPEEAETLAVPPVHAGRCPIYIESIRLAKQSITDRPVLAGVIGPFSLAGRLMDVSEVMINCYVEPDMVHATLKKATAFLIDYIRAYTAAGADGIVMAEPLTGMLSPGLVDEFSSDYIRQIVEAVQDDDFIVIYHNCGDNTLLMVDSILSTGAAAYHFGNAIRMADMLDRFPADTLVMGNLDPAGQLKGGTPDSVRKETLRIMGECFSHPNFVISTGCDVPPASPWDNIDAFFEAVEEFYNQ